MEACMSYVGFLTFLFPDVLIMRGELEDFSLTNFKDRIAKHFYRAGLQDMQVAGGIDIALTVFRDGITAWQPHLHATVWCPLGLAETLKILRDHTKASKRVPNPVDLQPLTDNIASVAGYTFKSHFDKRVLYLSPETDEERVRTLPPPDWAQRELRLFLDSYPIKAREFRMNLRRGRNGMRTIERTTKRSYR